ncbi:MAG: Coenzyme F420 hydrogenase/dehydrogenase, beta subunit C-terminal domain [Candidatus Bathyarchaeia archaeon]|jgi:coenzyme F420 hydrogenase subunit beta
MGEYRTQPERSNISGVVESGLCTGCGTCDGICPKSAIRMQKTKSVYLPIVNDSCNYCGLCSLVCPGAAINFNKLNLDVFGHKSDSFIGNHIGCYIGHSTDTTLRSNSTSGGLVSELLRFCLSEKYIDGALVTRMNVARPLEPEPYIARTEKEILEAAKSKYCPVPLNSALKILAKSEGKFAVVGLPCHIAGLRKTELIDKNLAKKIVLHFGLFCNHAPTFSATDYLLKKLNVNKQDVLAINYRGNGWPGRLTLTLKGGREKSMDHFDPYYWGHVFNSYFHTPRCMLCNDKSCELADYSLADAWHHSDSSLGESIIISRNKLGQEILKKALEMKKIKLKSVSCNAIMQSQSIIARKRQHEARVKVFKQLNKRVPTYNQEPLQPKLRDYPVALLSYLRLSLSSNPQLWALIDIYPKIASKKFTVTSSTATLKNDGGRRCE